jgi:hypothetical protein
MILHVAADGRQQRAQLEKTDMHGMSWVSGGVTGLYERVLHDTPAALPFLLERWCDIESLLGSLGISSCIRPKSLIAQNIVSVDTERGGLG